MKARTILTGVLVLLTILSVDVWASGEKETAATAATTLRVYAQDMTPGIDRGQVTLPPLTEFAKIAEAYEKAKPGINIEFVELPKMNDDDYMRWLLTQTLAGSVPEITYGHATILETYAKDNYFVDLMPYLAQPTGYVSGNVKWIDLFGEKIIAARINSRGQLWSMPMALNATTIYYNRNEFTRLGLKPPASWKDLMTTGEKIKQAGKIPFLLDLSNSTNMSWAYRVMMSFFYEPLPNQIDVLLKDDVVSAEEFARAVKKGIIDASSPRHKDIFRLFDEWKNYFQKGFHTKPTPGMFQRGEALMVWDMVSRLIVYEQDPNRKFEIVTFYMPPITKASS